MPEAEISAETLQILHAAVGSHVTLYTDGSSRHQSCPVTRYASYSLVADLATDDAMRLEQCQRFLTTAREPDTLQVLAKGRVQGIQGIHRAELTVIMIACETLPSFDLYTDSAVSLAALAKVRTSDACHVFSDHPDFDLLIRIFRSLKATHVFHKIKAHVDVANHACNLQLYHQLGNKRANDTAVDANQSLLPEAARELEQFHKDIFAEQQYLATVYDYILALQMVKMKVDMTNPAMGVAEQCRLHAADPLDLLSNWTPDAFWMAPRQVQGQGLESCPYGQQVAIATLKFLRQCKWPTEVYGPHEVSFDVGNLRQRFGQVSGAALMWPTSDLDDEVPRTPPRPSGSQLHSPDLSGEKARGEAPRPSPGDTPLTCATTSTASTGTGEKLRKASPGKSPITPSRTSSSQGVVVPDLEFLIDQTMREIRELETKEQIWSQPDDFLGYETQALESTLRPLPTVDPPEAPRMLRARKSTGRIESQQRQVTEVARRKAVREYLREACKPRPRALVAMVAPKLEISDAQMRRPWENSMESLSYNPLAARIHSQVIW
eukprot:s193_g35.t1